MDWPMFFGAVVYVGIVLGLLFWFNAKKERGPEMEEVWLRFIHEDGITSRAIEWFTRSEWCHVDFALPDGSFLGARLDGGVQARPHDYLVPAKFCYGTIDVKHASAVIGWASQQIGKPYDWRAIFSFVSRGSWHEQGEWFCSELVAEAFRMRASVIVDNKSYRVTPEDVFASPRFHRFGTGRVPSWVKDLGHTY